MAAILPARGGAAETPLEPPCIAGSTAAALQEARLLRPLALSLLAALLLAACSPSNPPAPTPPPTRQSSPPPAPPSPSSQAALGASPVASPGAFRTSIPTADPAVHVFLWGHPDTTARDLALARSGGFHWVKQRFEWRNIERDGKGKFEWQEPDRIVKAIQDAGLKIVARVDNQPKWASSKVAFPASGPPDNLKDWTDYLTALASRYRGRIQAYEIWNEPNLDREWGGRKPSPAEYTELLKASYQAIKAADPQALVISAGMSPTTTSSDQAMRDLDFYRGMYQAGARASFDLLGVHAAGFKAPPCEDPATVAADPALTNNDPSPTDVKRVYAFRHVEDVRRVMVENGDAEKQMAVLEMGWTTDLRPNSPYRWHSVTQEQQAQYLVDAFKCARQRWSPWMGFMTVIYIPDPSWTPQQEQFWWSITNPDGSPRPAYTALKEYLAR